MNGGKVSYNYCYLVYMAMRLIECYRILKNIGSIYLHCDPTMSHYLKLLLDCIFREKNFLNEIIWCYTGPSNTKGYFPRKHDVIFLFGKNSEETKKRFNWQAIRVPYVKLDTGKTQGIFKNAKRLDEAGKVPEDWWSTFTPVGRVKSERIGYPTQKPVALLERIIKASSNENDVVLDPFCGCATTCVAAEKLNRKWVGIDVSIKAYELVKERLEKEVADPEDLFKYSNVINFHTDPPKRADQDKNYVDRKYVYIAVNSDNVKLKDWFKVGVSQNPEKRPKSAFDPFGSNKIIYKLLKENYVETEDYIHQKYESVNEWVTGVDFNTLKQEIDKYGYKKPVQIGLA